MLLLHSFIYSISCLVKKCMKLQWSMQVLLWKKKLLLNFPAKCIGSQIKAFSFLLCTLVVWKVQKAESITIQSDCKTMSKERTDSSCVYTLWKSTKKWRALLWRMIMKQQVKNEQIKNKLVLCFVKVIKFQENKFKIIQKNF